MTFTVPELVAPKGPGKAWLCVVNADNQGLIEYEGVSRIWVDEFDFIVVHGGENKATKLGIFALAHVWGAWLEWPYQEVRYNHSSVQRGPQYFLEFNWAPWEWIAANGANMRYHDNVAHVNSIWCDEANTDINPMTADVHYGYSGRSKIGWVRKKRVSKYKRVESFHYPRMP